MASSLRSLTIADSATVASREPRAHEANTPSPGTAAAGHGPLSLADGRGYGRFARPPGGTGRGAVAGHRPGVRAADGTRPAAVPDRAAAGRARGPGRAGPGGCL